MPTYFAELDKNGIVLRIIVADEAFIKSGAVGTPSSWMQTDMNGKIRINPAVVGGTYDNTNDCFLYPQPFKSWTLGKDMQWHPPKIRPVSDELHRWDEEKLDWFEVKV